MTLAKALGNGVPIGACLANANAAELMQPGSHGSTFGGNPLAARVALTVISVLDEIDAPVRAQRSGQILLDSLQQQLAGVDGVRDIRGKGLMLGIELERDCPDLVQRAMDRKLLINVTAGNVIRLLPPLVIENDQLQQIADGLTGILTDYLQEEPV